ncbi:FAD-binding oxidoreductase [Mesorhizobium sp. BAC0120]|uniref:NAD(P)/FAD-dependent oxidoreductase n=1 Tax=Mesorhizobium sp. BAC0120 TaxID=3090670 RepID=UPI00298CDED6|nr:FAD-binding oxidoreductase [Mesorhizobium sp. BAC0120]MDW6023218.1 FAD-binding oxidoreductase [Mesorhizobium sp. BAC0120]
MSDVLPRSADVVIVGGGIVGTAVARQLAYDGLSTVLLEGQAFGGAVSGASLACLGTHMHNLQELDVLVEACAHWRELSESLGDPFEYNHSGQLRFIMREEDVAVARRWIDAERAHGLPPELLSPEAVREREPLLTGPIVAASWSPGDATVNPFLAVRALLADGRRHGVSAFHSTPVTGLTIQGDRVTGVQTAKGPIAVGKIVIAAGPWSAGLAAMAGVNVPIVPRQAQCLASVRQPPIIRTVVGACESAGGVESGYTQIQQARSGQVLFNTVVAPEGTTPGAENRINEVPLRFVRDSIQTLTTLFPSLADILMLRSWVRFEGVTPDDRFLAGKLPPEGLYIAAGDNGTGFCRAPYLGRLISRLVRGVAAAPSDALYDPARFAGVSA